MDDENGHRCLFHCPGGVHFVNVKAAVDPPADFHKRPCQAVGHVHIPCDLADDVSGGGIGAVGDDSFHVFGQVQPGSHQHRRRTHGNAVEDNLHICTESLHGVACPAFHVPPLLNAKGDGAAFASAVGAFVDEQEIVPHRETQLTAPGEVRQGAAAVAVKADVQRRTVFDVVITPEQGKPVERYDGNLLVGTVAELAEQAVDLLAVGVIFVAGEGGDFVPPLFRGVECDAVGIVPSHQQNCRDGTQKKQKNRHIISPGYSPSAPGSCRMDTEKCPCFLY